MATANKKTALRMAASHGRGSDLIRLLTVKTPATLVDQLDGEGETALSFSVRFGRGDSVSCLLCAGANDQAMVRSSGLASLSEL